MKENMQKIDIRIEKEFVSKLDQKASELGLNRSALIRLACTEFLAKYEMVGIKNQTP